MTKTETTPEVVETINTTDVLVETETTPEVVVVKKVSKKSKKKVVSKFVLDDNKEPLLYEWKKVIKVSKEWKFTVYLTEEWATYKIIS